MSLSDRSVVSISTRAVSARRARAIAAGGAPALARPLHGPKRVAGAVVNLVATAQRLGLQLRRSPVNGRLGGIWVTQEGAW